MTSSMTFSIVHPPVLINAYLADKIQAILPNRFSDAMRFFPTQPTDINALTEQFPEAANDVFAVYDRMFRLRRTPFPYIKQEQLLYYFYKMAGDPEALIETVAVVLELLDRGDESAQEVNSFLTYKFEEEGGEVAIKRILPNARPILMEGEMVDPKEKDIIDFYNSIPFNGKDFLLPYFHEFKMFQLEEARDIIAFGTARTYAGNKLILNYNWHRPEPIRTEILPKN